MQHKNARRQKPSWVKDLALKRINRLFELAEQQFNIRPDRSTRYVELARKLSTRYNVTIPKDLKQKFCKKCNAFLIEGKTLDIDTSNKDYDLMLCKVCGHTKKQFKQ